MNLPIIVLILIILFGVLFFIVGIIFSIFLFFNTNKNNFDDLSEEDKEKLDRIIEEKERKIEFKHLYFL